jgi:predicted transcriptional regulator
MNTTPIARQALLGLTTQIVAAYLKNNEVAAADLPNLIRHVHGALATAGVAPPPVVEKPAPPAPPKRTIFNDYIICLEDGRKLKTLKRHLNTTYGLSPDQYREKWGLPADYPMVAPSYAARRSSLAKSIGLGRKAAQRTAEPELPLAMEPDEPPLPAMPRFIIAPADSPRPAPPPGSPQSAQAPQRREGPAPEPTAESVFAKFTTPPPEPDPDPTQPQGDSRKAQRKPFSKQLARSMRP